MDLKPAAQPAKPDLTTTDPGRTRTLVVQKAGAEPLDDLSARTLVVQKVEAELRETTPELASLVAVDIPAINELQALLPADEVAVEYYLGGEALYAFLVSRGGVQAIELQAKGLADEIRSFRRALQDVGPVEETSRRLYDRLGIPDRTAIEYFNGPHTIHGVGTYAFLHRHLGWPEPGRLG